MSKKRYPSEKISPWSLKNVLFTFRGRAMWVRTSCKKFTSAIVFTKTNDLLVFRTLATRSTRRCFGGITATLSDKLSGTANFSWIPSSLLVRTILSGSFKVTPARLSTFSLKMVINRVIAENSQGGWVQFLVRKSVWTKFAHLKNSKVDQKCNKTRDQSICLQNLWSNVKM